MKSTARSNKNNKRRKGKAIPKLGPSYRRDFEHRDSGHAPERVKRLVCCLYNTTLGVNSGTVFSQLNSSGVTNTPEFVAIKNANIYREFRVVAMRCRVQRRFQQPFSTGDKFGALIGCVISGDNSAPNDNQLMFSSQGFKVAREPEGYLELTADAGLNPNALLWTSVKASPLVPPDNSLGIGFKFTNSTPASGYGGVALTDEFYEWDVEFRTT